MSDSFTSDMGLLRTKFQPPPQSRVEHRLRKQTTALPQLTPNAVPVLPPRHPRNTVISTGAQRSGETSAFRFLSGAPSIALLRWVGCTRSTHHAFAFAVVCSYLIPHTSYLIHNPPLLTHPPSRLIPPLSRTHPRSCFSLSAGLTNPQRSRPNSTTPNYFSRFCSAKSHVKPQIHPKTRNMLYLNKIKLCQK